MYYCPQVQSSEGFFMADRTLLLALLINLETEMREMGLWEPQSPPASAFDSQVPFCYDTMNFAQWLQWVFIARFRAILEGSHPLPQNCDVVPIIIFILKILKAGITQILIFPRNNF